MSDALRVTVAGIERMFERYPELAKPNPALAFSGGKDSVALALALRTMGVRVTLRAVDMGYNPVWRTRIEALASQLSLPLELLNVNSLSEDSTMKEKARHDLTARRALLDTMDVRQSWRTPCTNCYNCKILALVHGVEPKSIIYFAHHSTDAVASFLKSAVMAHERFHQGNLQFDKTRFRSLAWKLGDELRQENSLFVGQCINYLDTGLAHTSEPPIEFKSLHGLNYIIGRPLFDISEKVTLAMMADYSLKPESSGCGHTLSVKDRTPREIIHHEIIPMVEADHAGRENLAKLMSAIVKSLTDVGTANFDWRSSRHLLYGSTYKGGPVDLGDRL